MNELILTSKAELKDLFSETVENSILNALKVFQEHQTGKKLYFRNQVAKMLNMGNDTVKKLIDKCTPKFGLRVRGRVVVCCLKLKISCWLKLN